MQIIFSLTMAALPSLLLVYYYYHQDVNKAEPKRLVLKIFIFGIIYSFPVYLIELAMSALNVYKEVSYFIYYFFEAFIVAGLCEEYIKLRIVRKHIYNHPEFNEIMDGIVYTVIASLGFACMENVLYVMNSSWHTAIARGFTAVPMHAVCSGIMGYYVGLAKFSKTAREEKYLINKGLWKAILLHGLYNFFLFLSPMWGSMFSILSIIVIYSAYIQLKGNIENAIEMDQSKEN